jgi:hypothetical protein
MCVAVEAITLLEAESFHIIFFDRAKLLLLELYFWYFCLAYSKHLTCFSFSLSVQSGSEVSEIFWQSLFKVYSCSDYSVSAWIMMHMVTMALLQLSSP